MGNPAYEVNSLDPVNEGAKTPEAAKAGFDVHLEQAYRVLSGQRMTKEYRERYGIENKFWKYFWGLTKFSLLAGIAVAVVFWLTFPTLALLISHIPFLKTFLQPYTIIYCWAGGLAGALMLWLIGLMITFKMSSRY